MWCNQLLNGSKRQFKFIWKNLQVWAVLLISVLALTGILKLITHIQQKYFNQHNWSGDFTQLSTVWIYVCSTLTNQGMKPNFCSKLILLTKNSIWQLLGWYFHSGGVAVGITVTAWCLASFILVNIYTSCITTYMSLTTQRPDIVSFHDLAISSAYKMAVSAGSSAEVNFLVR